MAAGDSETSLRRSVFASILAVSIMLAICGFVLLLLVLGKPGFGESGLDLSIADRTSLAIRGLCSALLLALAFLLPLSLMRHTEDEVEDRRVMIAPLVMAILGAVVAAVVALFTGLMAAFANSSGEAAYDYTGPYRSSPATVWLCLVPVAVVLAILFLRVPRLAAAGQLLVVLAGFVAIVVYDEVRPQVTASLWGIASIPLLAAALFVFFIERLWVTVDRYGRANPEADEAVRSGS